jgi:hypothetical protein
MSKVERVKEVVVQFRRMGASAFQLVKETKRLMTDDEYLNGWYSVVKPQPANIKGE